MIVRLAECSLQTKFGLFRQVLYYDGQKEIIAIIMGDISHGENVLCRIHSSCLSGHAFNSIECDCREQMEISQALIQQSGKGIVIWLNQEGRGNGHFALMKTAALKAQGISQSEAYRELGFLEDARSFIRAAEILRDLQVQSIVLLTNNPHKVNDLVKDGINIVGTREIYIDTNNNEELKRQYSDKIARGHVIDSAKGSNETL
jgi:GTP cyclohydrolase II